MSQCNRCHVIALATSSPGFSWAKSVGPRPTGAAPSRSRALLSDLLRSHSWLHCGEAKSESGSSTRRTRASAEPDNRRRVHYTFLTGRRMQCRPFFTASTDSRFAICIARDADGLADTLPGAAGACRTVRELCVLCVD